MDNLFQELFSQIEEELRPFPLQALQKAAVAISERYRRLKSQEDLRLSLLERLAYLAVRLPATLAVIQRVFSEIPLDKPMTLLDLGSGPGTVLWAAKSLKIRAACSIEKEATWTALAKKFWKGSAGSGESSKSFFPVEWRLGDLAGMPFPEADLLVASYSLNELSEKELEKVLEKIWSSTGRYFVWIEPGTPANFYKMASWRKNLSEEKASIIAPCQSLASCPYLERERVFSQAPGWCHFGSTLPRTALHRSIKEVSLGFEEEKFCYLIVEKKSAKPIPTRSALRLLQNPKIRKGHLRLLGCNCSCNLEERVFSKSQLPYKRGRKAVSGDLFEWEEQKR